MMKSARQLVPMPDTRCISAYSLIVANDCGLYMSAHSHTIANVGDYCVWMIMYKALPKCKLCLDFHLFTQACRCAVRE